MFEQQKEKAAVNQTYQKAKKHVQENTVLYSCAAGILIGSAATLMLARPKLDITLVVTNY